MNMHTRPTKGVECDSELLAAALAYARTGWPVFPCDETMGPKCKTPLVGCNIDENRNAIPGTGGLYKATTDEKQVRAWWTQWPTALIGLRMGEASGIFAIDPDAPKRNGDPDGRTAWDHLVQEHGVLPATRTHATPNGGLHILFRWTPERPVTNKPGLLPNGIDVRGEGGYIIAPPSRLSDGRTYALASHVLDIADAPEWLLFPPSEISGSQNATKGRQTCSSVPLHDSGRYAAAGLESECAVVASARPGSRNSTLNTAAFSLGTLVSAGALEEASVIRGLLGAATASGLVNDDGLNAVHCTIRSGMSAGMRRPRQLPGFAVRNGRAHVVGEEEVSRDAGPSDFALTQDDVARLFASRYSGRLRYCHDKGSWYEWTGTLWAEDRTDVAFQFVRELCREVSAPRPRQMKQTRKVSFASGVEQFARGDVAFRITAEAWDADRFLLGTPGGTVDLRTGLLRHSRPEEGITRQTAVAPSAKSTCSLWLRFLDNATGGDAGLIRFLQQWCGYCLTGDIREHALVFVYGAGGNGKSVFLNTTSKLLGTYAATAAMDTFTASYGDRHPTDLAMLRGPRLVTASETEEGRAWAESRIKQMTGGDPIAARFMRQDFFTYVPQFKLTIVGNHKPVLRNVDDAARRRFNLIPFTRKPPSPDRELEAKLVAEWPGILRWMIEGCLDWQANGLVRPAVVQDATAEYFSNQDLFGQWLDDECDVEIGNQYKLETTAQLFQSWSDYARSAGEDAGSKKAFSERMQRAGFDPVRKNRARMFSGIRLRPKSTFNGDGW